MPVGTSADVMRSCIFFELKFDQQEEVRVWTDPEFSANLCCLWSVPGQLFGPQHGSES